MIEQMRNRSVISILFPLFAFVALLDSGCKTDGPTTPEVTIAATPTGLMAVAGRDTVTVSWDAVSDATGYRVYWNTAGSVTAADSMVVAVASPLVMGGLTNGTTYYYRVSATNPAGESALSTEVSATPIATPPAFPTGLAAEGFNGYVELSWNAVADATGYLIYWDNVGSVDGTDTTIPVTTTTYTHSGLTNGVTYYYRVSALGPGGESLLSGQVEALANGALGLRLIACGDNNSFLVNSYGTLFAWGENSDGQLGIGTLSYKYEPAPVYGLSDVVAVDASRTHTVALTGSGQIFAWGENGYGQLGDGTTQHQWRPTLVSGGSDFVAIAAGRFHTVALKADGSVWAWGANSDGHLGVGHSNAQITPGLVFSPPFAPGFVAAGLHFSFYKSSNAGPSISSIYSWGTNGAGQLGTGGTDTRDYPSTISLLAHVTDISTRLYHAVALAEDGHIWAWGANSDGQLGVGHTSNLDSPYSPILDTLLKAVGAGNFHSIALGVDGRVLSAGGNGFGQLGDGTNDYSYYFNPVAGLDGIEMIAAGGSHNLALRNDGTLWAWGSNTYGQLGNGTAGSSQSTPIRVTGY